MDRENDTTMDLLRKRAETGEPEAQFLLGEAYRKGDRVSLDYAKAIAWFRKAADGGNADAQNNLGSLYHRGLGVVADSVEAVLWYQMAAEKGHAMAQFNLGLRYLHGDGVPLDDVQAMHWLAEAAGQGHVEAIGQLGTMYRFGRGVEPNYVAAADFHVTAAMEGDITSLGNLADYMTEIENAALKGSIPAALSLAKMYHHGLVVKRDQGGVYAWLTWATAHGEAMTGDGPYAEELAEWASFVAMTISASERKRGDKLLAKLAAKASGARLN